GEERVRVAHGVAQADDALEGGAGIDAPRQHRHRVAVVQQVRLRRHLGEVLADPDGHRQGAQATGDPADADGVTDRLAYAEAGRDVEVGPGGRVAPDLDRVDDVVGSVDRGEPVQAGGDAGARAGLVTDPAGKGFRVAEAGGIDV